ncbi:argininosuccinate lyase [Candidatus Microgenomates bacterium]|nr:MAG: argininosuccinate lyase [Candidatus Microgenomates bacterium]
MKKLWQKQSLNGDTWKLNEIVELFETKDDLLLDQRLLRSDVLGSMAHALMLEKIGIISPAELKIAQEGLTKILKLNEDGKFFLNFGDEDIHTKIELFLTSEYGEVGKKIHTGRSRNDQVLTALRFYTKEQLLFIWRELLNFLDSLLLFSKKYEFIAMPGYSHMQKAMPSSVGMWTGSFAEAIFDDLKIFKTVYDLNNQSPLGSAAGYGAPLDLDREFTAKLLGFKKVQVNPLYCQNSRGKNEAIILAALINILHNINKFSSDVLLFTTSEFNYFKVSEELCSGSSMLPQKKNIDIAELLRSKVHLVLGNYVQVASLSTNLISGYNRDFQETKKPLLQSLETTLDSLKIANILVNNITPNKEALDGSLTPEIFAAHKAFELVKKGKSFRDAYLLAESEVMDVNYSHEEILKKSIHIGGTGNLGLKDFLKQFAAEEKIFVLENKNFLSIIEKLI